MKVPVDIGIRERFCGYCGQTLNVDRSIYQIHLDICERDGFKTNYGNPDKRNKP